MTTGISFKEECKNYITERWDYISTLADQNIDEAPLNDDYSDFRVTIRECLTSKTKTYRYVLPTQLLAKSVNHSLDCRSLQASDEREGSFDARTIAHYVIVPFDNENHDVLGGSREPYVNNPLRCPAISIKFRRQQKNKADWDKLIHILDAVQKADDVEFTKRVFDQVLLEIYKLLENVKVIYPTPNRISLEKTIGIIQAFLAEKSGGDRLESVVTSLFSVIADKFRIFDEIRREKTNTADSSSGLVADIECYLDDKIVFLVEVKDRKLTLTQLNTKIGIARSKQIKEILFMAQKGVEKSHQKNVQKKIEQEFTSGQNIYISDVIDFSKGVLILLGEKGRVDFLNRIGFELDRSKSSIKSRKIWAELLREV